MRGVHRHTDVIPNQVFVGCPWRVTLPKYQKAIGKLKTKYPIRFTIVGWDDGHDAEDLLGKIKARIDSSSYALFDGTGGNPNVSLEYGYAEAKDIPRVIYLSTHKASQRNGGESPIISDLASKSRKNYKLGSDLKRLLEEFCQDHVFTKRFDVAFPSSRTEERKKRRDLALKLIHVFTEKDTTLLRPQISHRLRGTKHRKKELAANELDALITNAIKRLTKAGLLRRRKNGFALACAPSWRMR